MIEAAVLIGLAGWRMAHLLVEEDGPWNIFERFRKMMGLKEGLLEGFFPLLLSCIYCTSVWTTLLAGFLWWVEPWIVIIIAAMAIALITNSFAGSK